MILKAYEKSKRKEMKANNMSKNELSTVTEDS